MNVVIYSYGQSCECYMGNENNNSIMHYFRLFFIKLFLSLWIHSTCVLMIIVLNVHERYVIFKVEVKTPLFGRIMKKRSKKVGDSNNK